MSSPSYLVTMKCERCRNDFDIKYCITIERKRNKTPMLCHNCMKIYKSEHMIEICANRDETTKEQIRRNKSISTKKYWDNISDEDYTKRSKAQKQYYKSLSKDEMDQRMIGIRSGNKRYWNSKTKEERKEYMDKIKRILYDKLKNDPEFRSVQSNKISARMKASWMKLSEEERERRNKLRSIIVRQFWDNITDEKREAISEACKKRYKGLSDNNKKLLATRMQQRSSNYWSSLSIDEFAEKIDRLTANRPPSVHELRFIDLFNNSDLKNSYVLKHGTMQKNVWAHKWDFAIYLNDDIKLLIDIDGDFSHADGYDYDGKHSSEHTDESRFKSVPSGIKFVVIPKNHLENSITIIRSIISMPIEEFYNIQYNFVLTNTFPYPNYEDPVLLNSWHVLCKFHHDKCRITTRNRLGDMLMNHFHRSIWNRHEMNKISPYDAWNNKELMHKLILDNTIYINILNYNKILQGFNISNDAPKISYVSAGIIKILINKYVSSFESVFDPICGFGSVLLGSVASNKSYIGIDIRDVYTYENIQMIEFLGISEKAHVLTNYTSINPPESSVLVTCIDIEYINIINSNFNSVDDCIDFFINMYNLKTYMFIVPSTDKYKNFIIDRIIERYKLIDDKTWDVVIINK